MKQYGSIIQLKAVAPDGKQYGIKAISKDSDVHDIKGVKMLAPGEKAEMEIDGVVVYAHVKAFPHTELD